MNIFVIKTPISKSNQSFFIYNMTNNRTWLAFANEKKCNHRKALNELGFINWTTKITSKFAEDDIVYLFMSDDRAVRYKLKVAKINVPREDSKYWEDNATKDYTYRLELVDKYEGDLLNEDVLKKVGFTNGSSILNPSYSNTELINYINDVFSLESLSIKLPFNYIVVDLYSGSYIKSNTGHEVLNLVPNDIDGRFYGYIPPSNNPNIKQLGAHDSNDSIDGVMVVYVEKVRNSSNRKIIAFTDNAKVYAKSQSGESLNRIILEGGKKTICSYTIESDYIYDVQNEPNPFIFEISGEDLHMFRKQRFYAGRHPKQEIKMLLWLANYLLKKEREEDIDLDYQEQIQEVEINELLSETSKQQPNYNYGNSGKSVAKKAYISKQALKEASFKCMFDDKHTTFKTNKGVPYMEGHHLIPCTVSNSINFWSKFKRNIDCIENIICLCPTCHRRIHFGSKEEKEAIIKILNEKRKSALIAAGIDISLEELLSLYNYH